LVLIPAGTFLMGDAQGRPDEQPAHRVYVSAFEMAVLPVTNADYARFLAATDYEAPRFGDDACFNSPDQPVVGVSWFDAVAYCDWLSAATGATWRLPTEAERERAMRGGSEGRRFPWGDDAGPDGRRFTQEAPRPVGTSEPNGYGLLDIACNVHEWCSDWYGPEYYAASPERDPQGPASGVRRSSRGGAWRHQITQQNRATIEAVTMQPISRAVGPPTLDELASFDFTEAAFEDPLGIATSWEEKYAVPKAKAAAKAAAAAKKKAAKKK
jgi:formylglycine-generating enzyme required for sulfatase activity